MPAPLDCPGIECWQALFGDALPPDQRQIYERHLESCPACQGRLDRAEGGDALLQLARQVGDPTAAPADPTLIQVLERLHEAKGPDRAAPVEPADLYFLRPSDRPGVLGTLGAYEVQEVIGQGGMGVVLKAYEPALHRLVAIKVMAAAVAGSATARRRFTREAQAAAAVSHDHIVSVHGVHEADGLPYLVMQYVAGESLQDRLDRARPLEVAEVVRIGLQTASALAAAHAQGLIHRDIKPANLLLENGLARVKITDFGLARMADAVGLTQNGVVAGTPEYMAPEQARGEPVDHRADLFSLGSVLYAMCSGAPPFRGSTAVAVLRRVSDQAPAPLRSLNPEVPAWLEALVTRLLAKAPADRFQSAAEVAALLEGYLAHLRQPATAPAPELPSPPLATETRGQGDKGTRRQGDKETRRRIALLVSLSPCLLVLLLLGLVAFGLAVRGRRPAAEPPASDSPRTVSIQLTVPGERLTADESALVRRLRGHTGPVHNVLFTPDGRLVSAGGWPEGDRALRVWDPKTGRELSRLALPSQVRSLALSADGRFALTGGDNSDILYLDLEKGRLIQSLKGHASVVSWVAFAPDGRHAFSSSLDGTARLWDLDTGAEVRRFQCLDKQVRAGALSPDGRHLLTGGTSEVLQLWEVATGQEVKRIEVGRGWINCLAFTSDGQQVVVGDREAGLYDLVTGQRVRLFEGHRHEVYGMALSPDRQRLLTASWDGGVRLWDVPTGKLLRLLGSHDGFAFAVAFAPDGRRAASAGGGRRDGENYLPGTDHDIRLWDVTVPPGAGRD